MRKGAATLSPEDPAEESEAVALVLLPLEMKPSSVEKILAREG